MESAMYYFCQTCFQSTIWMPGTLYVKILHSFIQQLPNKLLDNDDGQQWTLPVHAK